MVLWDFAFSIANFNLSYATTPPCLPRICVFIVFPFWSWKGVRGFYWVLNWFSKPPLFEVAKACISRFWVLFALICNFDRSNQCHTRSTRNAARAQAEAYHVMWLKSSRLPLSISRLNQYLEAEDQRMRADSFALRIIYIRSIIHAIWSSNRSHTFYSFVLHRRSLFWAPQ